MSKRDLRRAAVMKELYAGKITKSRAMLELGVGRRQVDRLLIGYSERGVESLVHGNRGRAPANKTEASVVQTILSLAENESDYKGFNICHMCDLLWERQGIKIGRSTLDRLLREAKIRESGSIGGRIRRKRRERATAEGKMLQIDGSPHDWLEGRGPRMCLTGAIDDATGKVVYGYFRPTEDQIGYLTMLRSICTEYGLPESLYHDKHTILKSPKPITVEDELAGRLPQSQFQRVLSELGIASIPANSPQAKGRVERLWGVLQDRLVKEMRLEGIGTIDRANAFLPGFIRRYNERFAVEPANPDPAWVSMGTTTDLAYFFSTRESRIVRSDHTISWHGRTLQILPHAQHRRLTGLSVNVHITPEQELFIYDAKERLDYKVLPSAPKRQQPKVATTKAPDPEANAKRRAWLFTKNAA